MTNPPPPNLPHLSSPPSGPNPTTSPPSPDNLPPTPLLPQKSPLPLWLGIGGAILVLIGAGAYYLKSSQVLGQPNPTSYQECLAAKDSRIQPSYPATCTTSSGLRFTQPLTNDQAETISSPTPAQLSKPGELCGFCGGFAGIQCQGNLTCSLTDPTTQTDRAGLCIPVPKPGQTINAKDFCATGTLASPSATPTSLCQTDTDCPPSYTCLKKLTYEQNQDPNSPSNGLCIPTGPER